MSDGVFREALDILRELVLLKDIKDAAGKTEEYERRQPLAWKRARELLMLKIPTEIATSWPDASGCVALGTEGAEPAAPKGMDSELWSKVMNAPITFNKDDATPGAPSLFDVKPSQPEAIMAQYHIQPKTKE